MVTPEAQDGHLTITCTFTSTFFTTYKLTWLNGFEEILTETFSLTEENPSYLNVLVIEDTTTYDITSGVSY